MSAKWASRYGESLRPLFFPQRGQLALRQISYGLACIGELPCTTRKMFSAKFIKLLLEYGRYVLFLQFRGTKYVSSINLATHLNFTRTENTSS